MQQVQKYLRGVDGQCAVTVLPGANAITGHLIHLAPYVHADSRFLICFFGYLSNLAELQECSGVLEVDDIGTATTQTILALYQRFMNLHKGGSQREELLLSELQVHCLLDLLLASPHVCKHARLLCLQQLGFTPSFLAADCCIAVLFQGHYAFFLYDEQGKQVCSLMHMSPGTRCAFRFSSHLAPTYGLACTHA